MDKGLTGVEVLPMSSGGVLSGLMPIMEVAEAIRRHKAMTALILSEIWKDGVDAMIIPGSARKTLTQPGAQKLGYFFGLSPVFILVDKVEQWDALTGKTPLFSYTYSCKLYANGRYIAEAQANANSHEAKYMWRWVRIEEIPQGLDYHDLKNRGGKMGEPKFAVEKGETIGKYGKPVEYWEMFRKAIEAGEFEIDHRTTKKGEPIDWVVIDTTLYRIPNDDIPSLVNTIIKISQKRAYVGAIITAANASEFFTQDLEDMAKETLDHVIEGHATAVPEEEATEKKAAPKKEEGGKAPVTPDQVGGGGVKMAPRSVRKEKEENPTPWLVNGKHWSQDAGLIKNFTDFLSLHGWQVNDVLRVMSERMKRQFLGIEEIEAPVGEIMNAMLDWSKAEAAKQGTEKSSSQKPPSQAQEGQSGPRPAPPGQAQGETKQQSLMPGGK